MDMWFRIIAIAVEVLLLTALTYAVLEGVKLATSELGIGPKYNRAVVLALLAVGFIIVVFFIAHLIAFYPPVS
jgi:ABC-type transporter Mla maintaining outer membrane lipid asymmetry permease subunit MlaE